MSSVDLATLTLGDFTPHMDEGFTLSAPSGTLMLTLKETRALGMAKREGGAFGLVFVSPKGPFLPQAMYPVEHPALGTLEIFLVPIGPLHGGNAYEAIFT